MVTVEDQWLALLVVRSPALHLKSRDRFFQWNCRQVAERRHLFAQHSRFLIRACLVPTPTLDSLWRLFRSRISEYRDTQGLRHPLPAILALAMAAGCHGPEAISEFAKSLNHHQPRRLRCRPRQGQPRQFDVPSVDTIRRCLKVVDSSQLAQGLSDWMKTQLIASWLKRRSAPR